MNKKNSKYFTLENVKKVVYSIKKNGIIFTLKKIVSIFKRELNKKEYITSHKNEVTLADFIAGNTGKLRPKTLLLIDDLYPHFDRHAGGKTIFNYLEIFVSMGIDVKFCPLFSNIEEEPYHSLLCNMGIEIICADKVQTWMEKNPFLDYVFISRPQVIQYIMTKSLMARGIGVFYYGHDVHHLRMEREHTLTGNLSIADVETMKELEVAAVSMVTQAWYPSDKECVYMRTLAPEAKISAISPYVYDTASMPVHKNFILSEGIIFVGSSHGPNLDGLLWFIQNVLPLVHDRIPTLTLHVVGDLYAPQLKQPNSNYIKFEGILTQSELDRLYASVRLSVVPLRYGAGIKGKLIDALYHQVPVISTSAGAEGVAVSPVITVVDGAETMASAIVEQYLDEQRWNNCRPLFSPFLEEYFSRKVVLQEFSSVISTEFRPNEILEN